MKRSSLFFFLLFFILLLTPTHSSSTSLTTKEVNSIQTYIPIERHASSAQYYGVLGDLDNDNETQEVIWADGTNIYAFNATGALLWQAPVPVSRPVIGDFDRDGYTDDFYNNPGSSIDGGTAYNNTGSPITSSVNGSIHYANFTCSNYVYGAGDFNNDGYADDLVFERGNGTAFYSMISTCSYANPLPTYWNFSLGYTFPYTRVAGGLLLGDINLDGNPNDVVVTTLINWTYAIDSSGGLIWKVNVGGASNPSPMRTDLALIDLDQDGISSEVVVGSTGERKVVAINRTGHILWNFTTGDESATMAVGDFDQNGFLDNLAVATELSGSLGGVAVLDNLGNVIWNHSLPSYVSSVVVTDANGSGFLDSVIVGSTPCLAYDYQGNEIGRGSDKGLLFPGDFDGDGFQDDLMRAFQDLTLYRLGRPNVNCTLFAAQPLNGASEPVGQHAEGDYFLWFNLSNGEAFPLDIDCVFTTPSRSAAWHLNGQDVNVGDTTSYIYLHLDPGTYNLTMHLAHEGITFKEVEIVLSVDSTIGVPVLFFGLVGLTIAILICRRLCSQKITLPLFGG